MSAMREQRAYNVGYYKSHREREIHRVRARQEETLRFLRELRRVPCSDCAGQFCPHQMNFDHRDPSVKSFGLTTARAMLASREDLMREVAKCDVVCANCHRLRTRQRHSRSSRSPGSSKYLERKRSAWRAQARLLDGLRDVPCADCAERFSPCVMDFDHLDPAVKDQGVTRMIGRASVSRILAEAAKCDIVCANCHRRRTFDRRVSDRLASGRSSVG